MSFLEFFGFVAEDAIASEGELAAKGALEGDLERSAENDAEKEIEDEDEQNQKGKVKLSVYELGPTKLSAVRDRFLFPGPGFEHATVMMEEHERTVFESYGGKYVRTGATRASLTDSAASGAIRHLERTGLEFGSSVWWARFQGTTGPHKHGPPSAILRPTEAEAHEVATSLLRYILHGGRL